MMMELRKMLVRVNIIIIIITLLSLKSFASHMIGGDITYSCVGNNRFRLTITLYQDCQNGNQSAIEQDDPAYFSIFDKGTNALVIADSINSFSTSIVPPNFSNSCITNYPVTCMRKQVFIDT